LEDNTHSAGFHRADFRGYCGRQA